MARGGTFENLLHDETVWNLITRFFGGGGIRSSGAAATRLQRVGALVVFGGGGRHPGGGGVGGGGGLFLLVMGQRRNGGWFEVGERRGREEEARACFSFTGFSPAAAAAGASDASWAFLGVRIWRQGVKS